MLKKWLRNKLDGPIYLDCYTSNSSVYKAARISSAINHLPMWWKRLLPTVERPLLKDAPNFKHPAPTMRSPRRASDAGGVCVEVCRRVQ